MWELFSFRGRTSRLGYWRVQLLCAAGLAVAWMIGLFAMLGMGPIGAIFLAPMPVIYLAALATWFRRLHDRGKGIWWGLLFLLAPMIGGGVAENLQAQNAPASDAESLPFLLAALAISGWAFIELGFVRGQPGANRFGEPPVI